MKFAVLTCTGGRPELFALCKRWVERQIRKPDLWIVVTDTGEEITGLPPYATFAHVPPLDPAFSGPGYLAPAWSLFYGLDLVPKDHAAIIMEDDDWYSREHCAKIMSYIDKGCLVSYGDEVWKFHLPAQRWRKMKGDVPTEGNVGIHYDAIQQYKKGSLIVPRWDPHDGGVYPGFTKVDIKGVGYGLPGRSGATNHHIPDHKKARIMRPDPGNKRFIEKIGIEDAKLYLSLVQPCLPTKR